MSPASERELIAAQAAWGAASPADAAVEDRKAREARELRWAEDYEVFARAVAARRVGASEESVRREALICVAGEHFWPALLVAAWVAPERVLLLRLARPAAAATGAAGPSLLEALAKVTGLSLDLIEQQWIDGEAEVALYSEVRDFLDRGKLEPSRVVVDVSGAGPLGQAAGALAAEASGAHLALLSGGARAGGLPGDETVRLLASPAQSFGADALLRIREAFDGGRYADAEARATELGDRLFEPREAEVLGHLAAGYGAWHRFDFEGAEGPLTDFLEGVRQHQGQGGWAWARGLQEEVRRGRDALRELRAIPSHPESLAAGLPAILNHVAAARRALLQVDLDDALLLLHGTVERWVDLLLRCEFAVDPDDAGLVVLPEGGAELRFHQLGEALFDRYRPLPPQGPLLFRRAVQLLGALAPERIGTGDLGWIRGLGHLRNGFAHSLVPTHPTSKALLPKFELVEAWLARQLPSGTLEAELQRFTFPTLG